MATLTDEQKVRMLIGDNPSDTSKWIFSSDEISAALLMNAGAIFGAASDLCLSLSAMAASKAAVVELLSGELKLDASRVPQYYASLAEKYAVLASKTDANDYFARWTTRVSHIDGLDEGVYQPSADGVDDGDTYDDVYSKVGP